MKECENLIEVVREPPRLKRTGIVANGSQRQI
jgi:hypothetical protein